MQRVFPSGCLKSKVRAWTLTEIMMSVLVLSIVGVMGKLGINFTTNLMHQRALMEVQRDAQVLLHMVSRDVRNAFQIPRITPTAIELQTLNMKIGFNHRDVMMDTRFIGTVTYEFVTTGENQSFIERRVHFPRVPNVSGVNLDVRDERKVFLRNVLLPPAEAPLPQPPYSPSDPAQTVPTWQNPEGNLATFPNQFNLVRSLQVPTTWIFEWNPDEGQPNPGDPTTWAESVCITFNIRGIGFLKSHTTYSAVAMKRALSEI